MSKFSDFISEHNLHPRRIAIASTQLEQQTADDLKLIALKKQMKEGKVDKDEVVLKQKPHSGRPVTDAAIRKAMAGQVVSGPVKTRLVKAVNVLLSQKKKEEITIRELF